MLALPPSGYVGPTAYIIQEEEQTAQAIQRPRVCRLGSKHLFSRSTFVETGMICRPWKVFYRKNLSIQRHTARRRENTQILLSMGLPTSFDQSPSPRIRKTQEHFHLCDARQVIAISKKSNYGKEPFLP